MIYAPTSKNKLEKEEQNKLKLKEGNRNIRVETNEIENRRIEEISETKSWLFEEIIKLITP